MERGLDETISKKFEYFRKYLTPAVWPSFALTLRVNFGNFQNVVSDTLSC